MWSFGSTVIFRVFVFIHQTVLLHAQACSRDCSTAFGLVSHVQHIVSALFPERKGNFFFFHVDLTVLAVFMHKHFHVSPSFLVNLNRRFVTFVSQPVILTMVALLHDQPSLPKQDTVYLLIPPPRNVVLCILSSELFLPSTRWIEDMSQDFETFVQRVNLCIPLRVLIIMPYLFSVSTGARPPQICPFLFQIPAFSFLD